MFNENEFMTTRQRINEELSQRHSNGSESDLVPESRINCRGEDRNTTDDRYSYGLNGHPIGMVYSPIQLWQKLYEPEMALSRGTLFEELDLPFEGEQLTTGGSCCGK